MSILVADAIRSVTAAMQTAIEDGHRARMIDANDLIEILLSIADKLDPPIPEQPGCEFCRHPANRPADGLICPYCGHEWPNA